MNWGGAGHSLPSGRPAPQGPPRRGAPSPGRRPCPGGASRPPSCTPSSARPRPPSFPRPAAHRSGSCRSVSRQAGEASGSAPRALVSGGDGRAAAAPWAPLGVERRGTARSVVLPLQLLTFLGALPNILPHARHEASARQHRTERLRRSSRPAKGERFPEAGRLAGTSPVQLPCHALLEGVCTSDWALRYGSTGRSSCCYAPPRCCCPPGTPVLDSASPRQRLSAADLSPAMPSQRHCSSYKALGQPWQAECEPPGAGSEPPGSAPGTSPPALAHAEHSRPAFDPGVDLPNWQCRAAAHCAAQLVQALLRAGHCQQRWGLPTWSSAS